MPPNYPHARAGGLVAIGLSAGGEIRDRRELTPAVVPETYLHRPDELLVRHADAEPAARTLEALMAGEPADWELVDRPGGFARFELKGRPDEPGLPPSRPVAQAVDKLREDLVAAPNAIYCSAVQHFYSAPRYQGKRSLAQPVEAPARLPELDPRAQHPVIVGVVDTGMVPAPNRHRWLAGAIASDQVRFDPREPADEPDSIKPDGVLDPVAGHGTFITGLVLGGAPAVTVCNVGQVDAYGVVSEAEVLNAIDRVGKLAQAELGRAPDILNLSLGGWSYGDVEPPFLGRKLRELMAHGTLVVAAAGNLRTSRKMWPAAMPDVVAVAATGRQRHPTPWSSRGDWVDALARGAGVASTFYTGFTSRRRGDDAVFDGWARWSGTSFAAPRLAAAVARRMGEDRGLGAREAYEALRSERLRDRDGRPQGPGAHDFPSAWVLD